ncbi:MAG: ankyrin repeat domain-containing protein [Gemmatimonadales bacterium]
MTTPLPARPSLEWLRKRAKAVLASLRRTHPKARLADAQLVLARGYGFSSWRALKGHLDTLASLPSTAGSASHNDVIRQLMQAVGAGRLTEVRLLLARDPRLVNARGPHPFWGGEPQPLHVAVETGRLEMVTLLLDAGADIDGSNDGYDHWSPLLLALHRKHPVVARFLRRRGARVGLVEALARGDDRTALRLLRRGHAALPEQVPNGGSLLMFGRTIRAIDRLLELGVAVDLADRWGATPIEALSRLGRDGAPLVRHLVARGLRASAAEYARMGDRRSLEARGRTDPSALRDSAVLRGAVDFRHAGLAGWLLELGADPNARLGGVSDHTVLHSAAWNGDLRMVKLLLAHGADRALRDRQYDGDARGWAATAIEVEHNLRCKAVVSYLDALDAPSSDAIDQPAPRKMWKPLMDAAYAGDAERVRALLAAGANPNVLSNSTFRHRPLHRAIEHKKTVPRTTGHEAVVRLLLAAGADPARRALVTRLTALQLAATEEPRFVPLLRPHFGPLDIFHAAATLAGARVGELIGENPAAARAIEPTGLTPLHYCAASAMYRQSVVAAERQRRIAHALLAAGADPNARFLYCGTSPLAPLYFAAGQHDNPELVELLLRAGADPQDGEGIWHASDARHVGALAVFERLVPPAVLAAEATRCLVQQLRFGLVRGAAWLLAHGADPNVVDPEQGDAALHAAARSGAGKATIELLQRFGARQDLRNRDGKTARQLEGAGRRARD